MMVADTGPIIAFARIGRLDLLHQVVGELVIPDAVYEELAGQGRERPGAAEVIRGEWIQRRIVGDHTLVAQLPRDLGTLGGSASFAYSINALGQVVGDSFISGDAIEHAFLWQNSVMVDLNDRIPDDSGWVLLRATDINEAGQIVGFGILKGDPSFSGRALLLIP